MQQKSEDSAMSHGMWVYLSEGVSSALGFERLCPFLGLGFFFSITAPFCPRLVL